MRLHVLLWVWLFLQRQHLGSSRDYYHSIQLQFEAWATGKLQTIWMKMVGKLQCLGLSYQPLHFFFSYFLFISFSLPSLPLPTPEITLKAEEQQVDWLDFFPSLQCIL